MSSPELFDPILSDAAEELSFDSTDGLPRDEFLRTRNDAVPLIVAAQNGDLDTVSTLISRPDTVVDARGRLGETALHMAAALGHFKVVAALIKGGAQTEIADNYGSTPLSHCARFCRLQDDAMATTTMLYLHPRARDIPPLGAGRMLVQWAALGGNAPLIETLMRDSAVDDVLPDALTGFARWRRADTVLEVLTHASGAPSIANLRAALWCGSWDIVDAAYKKAAPSQEAMTAFAAQVLDDLLYEKIPHQGFTIEDVADRLLGQYGADANEESLAAIPLASGNLALLDLAVKHGLDVKRLSASQVAELLAEARGRQAPPEFAQRVAALREEHSS